MECITVKKGCEFNPEDPSPAWVSKHVKQARYSIQVVKCKDPICCKPYETNWDTAFPERFIPPPAVYKQGSKGLQIVEPSEYFKNPKDYKFATLQERLIFNMKE